MCPRRRAAASLTESCRTVRLPKTVVNQYCVGCHNEKLKVGGLVLDTISSDSISQHPEEWEKVVRKLRGRYMPPAGLPRPDEQTYNAVVTSLVTSLDNAERPSPIPDGRIQSAG